MTLSDADAQHQETVALPEADVWLQRTFLRLDMADDLFAALMRETPWEEQKVFVWGKWHAQPRLTAWYGDPGASYSYSGITMDPLPWTPALTNLRDQVQAAAGNPFNSVLLNLYRNERDRMGWHSDNEPELQPQPSIASVSLGETRELLFKRRDKSQRGTYAVPLTHGSLLLMRGDTQSHWLHSINRETKPCGSRINLTFRTIHHRKAS